MKYLIIVCLLSLSALSYSAAHIEKLQTKLIEKRDVVETLFQQNEEKKQNYKKEILSLSGRKNEIETEIQRLEIEISKMKGELGEIQISMKGDSANGDLTDTISSLVTQIKESLKKRIPFKYNERLASLEKIEKNYNEKLLSQEKTIRRLWSFIEDELLLVKENSFASDVIILQGEEKLAEIAKIGMTTMFFRTPDRLVGHVEKENNKYSYVIEADRSNQALIHHLIDSYKKQIRIGKFSIPYVQAGEINL